jgi:hypothetical protein
LLKALGHDREGGSDLRLLGGRTGASV